MGSAWDLSAMISAYKQGNAAENVACQYLETQGLTLVERNYRCRSGELDLVMRDGSYLVFVEVRCRRDKRYGMPAETVTKIKQKRLIRAATHYLQYHHLDVPCRFDIIAVTQVNGKLRLEWIQNAFQAV
jgi:putative endonuclease